MDGNGFTSPVGSAGSAGSAGSVGSDGSTGFTSSVGCDALSSDSTNGSRF